MIAIRPAQITRSKLVSSTAVDQPAYNAATTYSLNAEVVFGDLLYQSLTADNIGHQPDISPLYWRLLGVPNSMAMFDSSPATMTVGPVDGAGNPLPLVVSVAPGLRCSAAGLLRVVGGLVTVRVYKSQGGELLHEAQRNLNTTRGTYYSWVFEPTLQTPDVLFWDLSSNNTPYVTMTIDPVSGERVQVGLCVFGRQVPLGVAEYGFAQGTELRGRSYLDSNNNPVRIDRGYRKTITGTVVVNNDPYAQGTGVPMEASYNRVQSFLESNIGIPMLWALDKNLDDHRSAILYGDYERTTMTIEDKTTSKLSIEINGYF